MQLEEKREMYSYSEYPEYKVGILHILVVIGYHTASCYDMSLSRLPALLDSRRIPWWPRGREKVLALKVPICTNT